MKTEASPLHQVKDEKRITQRQYLAYAVPVIVSSISTPILGAVDTAVAGRLPDPSFMGAVAIGSLIFTNLYWPMGFLRVGTIGFTAQAQGGGSQPEVTLSFLRPLALALLFGLLYLLCQYPIIKSALYVIGPSETVREHASTYFFIRIWGAPFALVNNVINGWLIGMGKIRHSFIVLTFMNVLNMGLAILFVIGLGFRIEGHAMATLCSEISAAALGVWMILRSKQLTISRETVSVILETKPLMKMLKMNQDLFLRTLCLLAVFTTITSKGATFGETALAANAILMQIHLIMAYLFSGFADASSIFAGQAVGKKDTSLFQRSYSMTALWGWITAVTLATAVFLLGKSVVTVFTSMLEVREMATQYLLWMMIYPLVSFWGLQLEGIFIGATDAASIRNAMLLSLIVFFIATECLIPRIGIHGIWMSYMLFNLSRSILLWRFVPKITAFNKLPKNK